MTFPIVTEIPAQLQPLSTDTFGGTTAGAVTVAPVKRRIVD